MHAREVHQLPLSAAVVLFQQVDFHWHSALVSEPRKWAVAELLLGCGGT